MESVLAAHTARKKGKSVALNKVIVMSTEEIHLTVTKLERETCNNKEKKRTRRARHEDTELEIEDDLPIDESSGSELSTASCIIVDM